MENIRIQKNKYILMISFRDPYKSDGGTEKYIRQMGELYKKENVDIIVLFPLDLRKVYNIAWLHGWGININEKFIGIKTLEKVKQIITKINQEKTCIGVYIHNIIFMDLEELFKIISFRKRITLLIHDYSTCCIQENLRKNLIYYCGDSRLYDKKCVDCMFYNKSKKKHEEIECFLDKFDDLKVIAPSETAARLWSESYPSYREKVQIIPHLMPEGEWKDQRSDIRTNDIIRIAFVGAATDSKGWGIFTHALEAVKKENGNRLDFFYFGHSKTDNNAIRVIDVQSSTNKNNPMIEALRNNKIDAVILFSDWPETYSYTYYESVAAHCFVITDCNSGNIAAEVEKSGTGVVLANTVEALSQYLSDVDKLREHINSYRQKTPHSPFRYQNNMSIIMDLENDGTATLSYSTLGSKISAYIVNIIYRVVYSSFVSSLLPVANAPKASIDRVIKRFTKQRKRESL